MIIWFLDNASTAHWVISSEQHMNIHIMMHTGGIPPHADHAAIAR